MSDQHPDPQSGESTGTSGQEPADLLDSDPGGNSPEGLAGDLGISSERVEKVRGQAEPATHGAETTHPGADADLPETHDPAHPDVEPQPDPVAGQPHDPDRNPGHTHG